MLHPFRYIDGCIGFQPINRSLYRYTVKKRPDLTGIPLKKKAGFPDRTVRNKGKIHYVLNTGIKVYKSVMPLKTDWGCLYFIFIAPNTVCSKYRITKIHETY